MTSDEAYVTLVTNDAYAVGALVLGFSLRECHASRRLAVLITAQVTVLMRQRLLEAWDELIEVEPVESRDDTRLAILQRPELGITFTKIQVWRLTQFRKVVFLDADTLVLRNPDELFDYPELSAAPDIGWPDCFNSGVFVCMPQLNTYEQLCERAKSLSGSFDGADQGLLNIFFSNWVQSPNCRLSFVYNVTITPFYSYQPAYQKFKDDIKILHFIGQEKPWYNRPGPATALDDSSHKWWAVHDRHISKWQSTPEHITGYPSSRITSLSSSASSSSDSSRFSEKLSQYRVSWDEAEVPISSQYMRQLDSRMENLEKTVSSMHSTLKHFEELFESKAEISESEK